TGTSGGSFPDVRDILEKQTDDGWGGAYGGICFPDGLLLFQGSAAYYWSQSEDSTGYSLYFNTDGYVNPQGTNSKNTGFLLRCVL
ncbi:MAG: hypothetical protein LBC84_03490, partial [Prevotellaceae bacterium]|nr:hypothetical protein [Prevotellaceae bacterium]